MSVTIFVACTDKGEACWRPVHADHLHDDVYEITVEQEPRGEKWEFPPRSVVRCREHAFDDGTRGLLAYAVADEGPSG